MISVSGVTKHFDEVHALSEVNLDVAAGEFLTIVGPSGCGKSTLLRIIAGLVPSHGSVSSPTKGAFVFQDAALLPWRTVQKNVELLMELESFPKSERADKARSALSQVGLTGFEKNYPHQLSGGMKMRLSLARSLVLSPEYLLLDEPLSAVDELTREVLQEEIHELWKKEKFIWLYPKQSNLEGVSKTLAKLVYFATYFSGGRSPPGTPCLFRGSGGARSEPPTGSCNCAACSRDAL